jgi:uncharacterized protein (DUF433 family)
MVAMTTLNPIQIVPLILLDDGTIMITDTGVPLETVIARHNLGETPMEIHEGYPTIDLAVVHLIIAYYLSHKTECDAYVERQRQRTEAARARLEGRPGVTDHLNEFRVRAADFRAARESDEIIVDQ